ncbi:RLR1 [Candida margitis]|uniref:RLR1 n=1 Tax=Candida margitis TaxID=1775924 RepID=UPI0022279716|nr:RLR1 [Candida margitis]KAI5970432.1 RLR1 [Candida margitis]
MSFKYFTDDIIEQFAGTGSIEIFEALDSYETSNPEAEEEVVLLFTEMVLSFEEGTLKMEHIVDFLSQSIKSDDVARLFCQVLNSFPVTENTRTLLTTLSRNENVIKSHTISLYISSDFIKETDIVPSKMLSKSLNTKLRDKLYTQKKYNLLHEEIEGYSKFIVEIHDILAGNDAEFQVNYALQVIEKLVGHYSLDPNRCLDILFGILSEVVVGKIDPVVELLKKSRWWPAHESDNSSMTSLSIGGSAIAAKIIGLKILNYPKGKDLPESFKILVTILIKEGCISFGSVYKYMRPDEEAMKELEVKYNSKLEAEVLKAGANALALAAPLADDEDENGKGNKRSSTPVGDKTDLQLQANYKYQFLKAFLSNGLYWPSIYILTEYPFFADIDDEIPQLLNRMFEGMIDPLYKHVSQLGSEELSHLQAAKGTHYPRPGNNVAVESFKASDFYSFRPLKRSHSHRRWHYFYQNWTSGLPRVEDFASLSKVSREILKFIGPKLSQNVELFIKLCDIVHSFQLQEGLKEDIFHYFRNYIFPSMPLIKENSIAIDRAYLILAAYPAEDRFSVYGELYNNLRKNNTLIKIAYSTAEKATKDVLKRLSKENVRPMMRRLAKISFSNPLPCLLTILQQIESYDNLNSLVVETARYFNSYGWDNLTIAILIRLSSDRRTVHDNGMGERQWLQSLASFVGKICQKYQKAIDTERILLYLLKTFYSGDRAGLLVLKEMLISMGGIQATSDLTLRQIDMINCGSSLQKVVYRTIDDLRYDRIDSGTHLLKCILDLDAVNEFVILLCSMYNDLVFDADENQLKVLANRVDDLVSVIKLFVTLVCFFGDGNVEVMPITELHKKYNVPIEWGFDLWRPKKNAFDVLETQGSELCPLGLSSTLYTIFWCLSLKDVNFSDSVYNEELSKLESSIKGLRDAININSRDKDFPRATIENYMKDIEANEVFIKELPSDKQKHKDLNEATDKKIHETSSEWFASDIPATNEIFIKTCVIPRAIHSSFDAVFSARFVFKLQELGVENYSVFDVLEGLTKSESLSSNLFSCTPSEAENLGFFFAYVLKRLSEFTDEEKVKELHVDDFEKYRKWVYDYHKIILTEVEAALETSEYMSRNNTITFLKNLLGVYPVVEDHCETMLYLIEKVYTEEDKEDIKLSSGALLNHLKSRAKQWVPIWDFISISEEEKRELIEKKEQLEKEKMEVERLAKLEVERIENEKREAKLNEEKLAKEEELKMKLKKINYGSQSRPASRASGRMVESKPQGRYDEYQRNNEDKMDIDGKKEKTEVVNGGPKKKSGSIVNEEPTQKDNQPDQTNSTEDVIMKDPKEQDDDDGHEAKKYRKADDATKDNKPDDVSSTQNPNPKVEKTDILQTTTQAQEVVPEPKSKANDVSKRQPLPPQSELTKSSESEVSPINRRVPLPPQEKVLTNDVRSPRFGSRGSAERGYGSGPRRFGESFNLSAPPPPPPPPVAQSRSNFGPTRASIGERDQRGSGTRPYSTYDNRRGRGLDSRPSNSQRNGSDNFNANRHDSRPPRNSNDGNGPGGASYENSNKRRAEGQGNRGYEKRHKY